MLLSEIVKISSGFIFRGEMKFEGEGDYFPVIQMKDISEGHSINWDTLNEAVITLKKPEAMIQSGDILLRAKGHPHYAVNVSSPVKGAVAASQFFILRPVVDNILPEYVSWYLNQKPAQDYFNQHSAGTNIKHINKKTISDISIEIPPINVQNKIVSLYNLGQQEKRLLAQIQHKRDKLLKAQLLEVVRNH